MNVQRWISGIALGALLVAQTLPAQAGRMLCGMKAAERVEVCSRCDDSGPAATGGVLRARSCCRMVPSEGTESAPIIVTTARRISSDDDTALHAVATLPVLAGRPSEVVRFPATVGSSCPPIESPTRTTVLRN